MRLAPLLAVAATIVVGCVDDGDDASSAGSRDSGGTVDEVDGEAAVPLGDAPYVLLDDSDWRLYEALDPARQPAVEGFTCTARAEWQATYERGNDTVVVCGHFGELNDAWTSARSVGYALKAVDIPVFDRAVGGRSTMSQPEPHLLLLSVGGSTLSLGSPDLSTDDLVALAQSLVGADRDDWQAAGGQID